MTYLFRIYSLLPAVYCNLNPLFRFCSQCSALFKAFFQIMGFQAVIKIIKQQVLSFKVITTYKRP